MTKAEKKCKRHLGLARFAARWAIRTRGTLLNMVYLEEARKHARIAAYWRRFLP